MRQKIRLQVTAFILLFAVRAFAAGGESNGSISGRIYVTQPAPLCIYLVDEKTSRTPFTGLKFIRLIPDAGDLENGYIVFSFTNLNDGLYGIRCFQDINGNGKLDRTLFGPSEPWGFSWNRQPPPLRPVFTAYCHKAGTVSDIEIIVTAKE